PAPWQPEEGEARGPRYVTPDTGPGKHALLPDEVGDVAPYRVARGRGWIESRPCPGRCARERGLLRRTGTRRLRRAVRPAGRGLPRVLGAAPATGLAGDALPHLN